MDKFVHEYSREALVKALTEAAFSGEEAATPVEEKLLGRLGPVRYLDGYLSEFCRNRSFKAQTLVVEHEYVDRDYLTEYAGYYSTSFQKVVKKTTRLHFFSAAFTQEDLLQSLLKQSTDRCKEIVDSYLGFVVVRPMRSNFMGRTCLKHYPRSKETTRLAGESQEQAAEAATETRHYTVLRHYRVNLFGLPLAVSSIAFQEQDSVVGACASAALYSLLHGVKPLFDTKTFSALEITRMANGYLAPTSLAVPSIRTLPNTGLTFSQMFQTLGELGLSPTMVSIAGEVSHQADAVAILYAYLSAGLPILAHVALLPEEKLVADSVGQKDPRKGVQRVVLEAAKHAFTITGFSMAQGTHLDLGGSRSQGRLDEVSRRINKFYVHCDRIGPFSKFWVQNNSGWLTLRPDALKESKEVNGRTHTEELAYQGIGTDVLAVPLVFIIPTSEKLRLNFVEAYSVAETINFSLSSGLDVVWDIKVTDLKSLRKDWVECLSIQNHDKLRSLRKDLPRFCWRLIAEHKTYKQRYFEVVLDCTAVDAGDAIVHAVALSGEGRLAMEFVHTQLQTNLVKLNERAKTNTKPETEEEARWERVDPRVIAKLMSVFPSLDSSAH